MVSDFPVSIAEKTAHMANAKYPKSATGHAECGLEDRWFDRLEPARQILLQGLPLLRPTRLHAQAQLFALVVRFGKLGSHFVAGLAAILLALAAFNRHSGDPAPVFALIDRAFVV